jgi:hydrogenase maturation protease
MTAVIIGVGNPYRRDDGVGPAVIVRLRERIPAGADGRSASSPAGVRLEESDGEPSQLLELWSGAELALVVDAVRTTDGRPGRIHRRQLDNVGPVGSPASSHRVDLGDAVALAQAVDGMPKTLVLYGIEVVDTSFGPGLTPAVEAAVDEVATEILARLEDARDVPA